MQLARYNISPNELLELGHRLARQEQVLAAMKEEKKIVNKRHSDHIKTLEDTIAELSQKINDGYEEREIVQPRLAFEEPIPVGKQPRKQ